MAADRRLIADAETAPVHDDGMRTVRRNEALRREESLGELFRELADESVDLIRQEVNLAKLEIRDTTSALARDLVKMAVAVGVAAVGGLALVASAIIVLGEILGDAYWAGALIVGVVLLLIGAILAKSASSDMKNRDVKPDETIQTLREDKRWARGEARDFKRQMMS